MQKYIHIATEQSLSTLKFGMEQLRVCCPPSRSLVMMKPFVMLPLEKNPASYLLDSCLSL